MLYKMKQGIYMWRCCVFVCTEQDFLLSQAALLEQVSNLQPLLDSTYIRGEFYFVGRHEK